jgi:hypothetical protein
MKPALLKAGFLFTFVKKNIVIAIDNVLLSDDIATEQFVCDLNKCKGGCCVDGDAGAPLEKNERKIIDTLVDEVKPLLTTEALQVIKEKGNYVPDSDYKWCTPTIGNGICVYGLTDNAGIVKCAFEKIYNEKNKTSIELNWKKPISCHLYPIIITKGKINDLANYEPRPTLCAPACANGQKLKVPVYQFLKEPLVRKYGEQFYEALEAVAKYKANGNK